MGGYISVMAFQINDNVSICSSACLGLYQRKYQISVFMAFCEGNPPITSVFLTQKPVMR